MTTLRAILRRADKTFTTATLAAVDPEGKARYAALQPRILHELELLRAQRLARHTEARDQAST